jgi:lipid-A-disaccharide synthase
MKILVSALEHSANIHLKSLKKELSDDVEFIGIFDKELGKPIVDLRSLAIMGFVDVIKKIRFFFKLNAQMVELSADVDKVLLIDSSGFNLPLGKKIKKRFPDKEIIYYILPQAWAWKKKRIPILAKTIDHLASILPFEKDYYPSDAPITYVGHPLLDQIKVFKDNLNEDVKNILFMPGSRKGEIKKLIPIYKQIIKQLENKEFILIIPPHFNDEYIKEVYGNISEFTVSRDTYDTLENVEFAFICSGTATLEASLIGTPFVLNYIASKIDYFIASKIVKIKYIGLANIFFEQMGKKPIHKEFVQDDVTIKNLLDSYHNIDKKSFLENSKTLRQYLQHGSSKTVALELSLH